MKTQVSAVGFEPGTFRSCVAHSIHYATETPPIPDVLLVLVAPKHINRNGTTTLQSRFTPTPQATHSSFIILFYFILLLLLLFFFFFLSFIFLFLFLFFYFIFLFIFFLFYFFLFYFCETSQYPALFSEVGFFNIFSSKSLSFNMADLGGNGFFP